MEKLNHQTSDLTQLSDESLEQEIQRHLRRIEGTDPSLYQECLRYRAETFVLLAIQRLDHKA